MTIQSAIRSGKPFRRKVWARYYGKHYWFINKNYGIPTKWTYIYSFRENLVALTKKGANSFIKDILATDWEIKKEGGK
jgi:hypothetical protein